MNPDSDDLQAEIARLRRLTFQTAALATELLHRLNISKDEMHRILAECEAKAQVMEQKDEEAEGFRDLFGEN